MIKSIAEAFANGTTLVPYTSPGEWVGSVAFLIIGCIGTIAIALVLISTAFQKNLSPSTYLLLFLCFSDFICTFGSVLFSVLHLLAGGFSTGPVGCKIACTSTLMACFCSVFTLLSIAVERYLSILCSIMVSRRTVFVWIGAIFLAGSLFAMAPFILQSENESIALQPSKLLCLINWAGTTPSVAIIVLISLPALVMYVGDGSNRSSVSFTYFAYLRIVWKYIKIRGNLKDRLNQPTSLPASQPDSVDSQPVLARKPHVWGQAMTEETRLLFKAVVISGCFTVCWILFDFITKQSTSPAMDAFSANLALLNSAVNPFLLLLLDSRIKRNVHELLEPLVRQWRRS
ncbi:hypothetical protein HDU91_001439 [Kappamyces sp. JEL0680]|nr:hypothetical protein HDU91_001439 [Kappamyces sp. JEL0680]